MQQGLACMHCCQLILKFRNTHCAQLSTRSSWEVWRPWYCLATFLSVSSQSAPVWSIVINQFLMHHLGPESDQMELVCKGKVSSHSQNSFWHLSRSLLVTHSQPSHSLRSRLSSHDTCLYIWRTEATHAWLQPDPITIVICMSKTSVFQFGSLQHTLPALWCRHGVITDPRCSSSQVREQKYIQCRN
jgi:hypothetical protein